MREVETKFRTSKEKEKQIWEAIEREKAEVGHTLYKLFIHKFYEKLDSQTKSAVYAGLRKVLLGTFPRGVFLKEIYDYGLLYYNDNDKQVPVNKIAESVLSSIWCKLTETECVEISLDIQNRQGSNFEDQVLANICNHGWLVKGVSYTTITNEKPIRRNILLAAESLNFFQGSNMDEMFNDLSMERGRTLWKSTDESFVCDGIIFPAMSSSNSTEPGECEIIIFDTSITNPYNDDRRKKMMKLKQLANEISILTKKYQAFTNSKIILVGMWNHDFKEENTPKEKAKIPENETSHYDHCYVVEKKELTKLFIKF